MKERTQLARLLDSIWHSTGNRIALAKELTSELLRDDILVLASWDLAAIFSASVKAVDLSHAPEIRALDAFNRPILCAVLVEKRDLGKQSAFIHYAESPYCVIIKESLISMPRGTIPRRSVSSLLSALQLVRDHVDSVLFLPSELRQKRLEEFAAASGLDVEQFRLLALAYPAVEKYL